MSRLILASASRSRQTMLRAAGVEFTVQPADLDEAGLTAALLSQGKDGAAVARALAEEKTLAVSRQNPRDVILGGDSVLALGTELIGKSPDLPSLKAELRRLSGKTHLLISAACLARDGQRVWYHVARARMTMRVLSEAFLDDYLAHEGETLLGSVGGYHFEGRGAQLFDSAEGDYFSILGLPLLPVLKELRAQGWLRT
ncbi:MAG TPA: Maf family protein [Rhizomicrobium sp.]|nr:Maf family protein [Rhizomicrobium sp.]